MSEAAAPLADPQAADQAPREESTKPARGIFAILLVFIATAGIVSAVYWPGQMDPDTLDELGEAASGHFTDWHTPILSALWRIPYLLGIRNPGWLLFGGLLVLLIGYYLVCRIWWSRPASTALSVAFFLFPPVLSWSIHVGRDEWFVAFMLCTFGFSARVAKSPPGRRKGAFAAAALSSFLAFGAFQIALVPIALAFYCLLAAVIPRHIRLRRTGIVIGSALSVLAIYGVAIGVEGALHVKRLHPQQATFEYDLGVMSHLRHKDLFPATALSRPESAMKIIKADVSVGMITPILFGKTEVLYFPAEGSRYSAIRNAWVSQLVHHPTEYLSERASLAGELLSITRPSYWVYQYPPDPPGYSPLSARMNQIGLDYLNLFTQQGNNVYGDALYDVWAYIALCILMVAAEWTRIRSLSSRVAALDLVPSFLALSVIAYFLVMTFTVPGLVYRYAYPAVAISVVFAPVMVRRGLTASRRMGRPPARRLKQDGTRTKVSLT